MCAERRGGKVVKKKSGCWLIILCMLISLAGCGKQETALITGSGETVSQSSEMAAVTVNDEEISLREWNFYEMCIRDSHRSDLCCQMLHQPEFCLNIG